MLTWDTHLIKEEKEDRHEEKGDDDDTHLIKEEKEDRHEEKGEDGSSGAERSKEQTTGDYHYGSHNVQKNLDGSFACLWREATPVSQSGQQTVNCGHGDSLTFEQSANPPNIVMSRFFLNIFFL